MAADNISDLSEIHTVTPAIVERTFNGSTDILRDITGLMENIQFIYVRIFL